MTGGVGQLHCLVRKESPTEMKRVGNSDRRPVEVDRFTVVRDGTVGSEGASLFASRCQPGSQLTTLMTIPVQLAYLLSIFLLIPLALVQGRVPLAQRTP